MSNLQTEICEAIEEVSSISYNEKKYILSENERNNIFLDAVLSLKERLVTTAKTLSILTEKFEHITWHNIPENDDETLKKISNLIDAASGLHHSLIKQYVSYNLFCRKKGIAVQELKSYKSAIGEFKEAISDIEFAHFKVPNDVDFKEIENKLLSI